MGLGLKYAGSLGHIKLLIPPLVLVGNFRLLLLQSALVLRLAVRVVESWVVA